MSSESLAPHGAAARRAQRPTMNDVAAAANVSAKTVSRVVNGDAHVSPATLRRVNTAIERLGFRRNESARQLRQGRTSTIALIHDDIGDPFYGALTRAVEEVVLEHDHLLFVSSSAEERHRAERLIASFISRGVDGIILAPAHGLDPELIRHELDAGCPIVVVDRPIETLDADTVLIDNRGSALAATRHLIEHGHRRIAYFGDDETVYTARERRAGYLAALAEAGIEHDPALETMASPDYDLAEDMLGGLLATADAPTAVIGGNNRWSVRWLRSLRGAERSIAFLSFDDFELADVMSPGITVVAQNPGAMGRVAAEQLFRRITGEDSPAMRLQLSTTLIERGSGEIPGPFAH